MEMLYILGIVILCSAIKFVTFHYRAGSGVYDTWVEENEDGDKVVNVAVKVESDDLDKLLKSKKIILKRNKTQN